MSEERFALNLCESCVAIALGMKIEPLNIPEKQTRCQFCKKKLPVTTYLVQVEGVKKKPVEI